MKLVISPVWTYILWDNRAERFALRSKIVDLLAVRKKDYYFSHLYRSGVWDGRIKFYDSINDRFPTGFLHSVMKLLEVNGASYVLVDRTETLEYDLSEIKEDMLAGITLRDYQLEAIKKAVQEKRGIIHSATNSGKTEIAAGIIKVLKSAKALYFVHRKDLLLQTHERLCIRLPGEKIAKLWSPEIPKMDRDARVFVATIQTAYAKKRTPEIEEILKNVDVLFLDECHVLHSDEWVKVSQECEASYRYGMSGTPFTDDEVKDARLVANTGRVIYSIKNEQLIATGISAKPIVTFHLIRHDGATGDYYSDYEYFVIKGAARNRKICELAIDALNRGKQVVIMVVRIDHGEFLRTMFKNEYNLDVPFIHGAMNAYERKKFLDSFKSGKTKVLIASTIADEGIDVSAIKCMILAGGGKSKVKLLQRIGRGLRKKEDVNVVEIHDFIDDDGMYLYKHSRKRLKVVKSEGFDTRIVGGITNGQGKDSFSSQCLAN